MLGALFGLLGAGGRRRSRDPMSLDLDASLLAAERHAIALITGEHGPVPDVLPDQWEAIALALVLAMQFDGTVEQAELEQASRQLAGVVVDDPSPNVANAIAYARARAAEVRSPADAKRLLREVADQISSRALRELVFAGALAVAHAGSDPNVPGELAPIYVEVLEIPERRAQALASEVAGRFAAGS